MTIKKKRLIYLDLIRGLFLTFIIINHIPFAPKFTDIITGDGALISSAAEGFFLLSGLMVAYLYVPKILTDTKTVLKKVWKRSVLLYILSVTTTVVFTLLAALLNTDPTGGDIYPGSITSLSFMQDTLSLYYIYGWADYLARYAVFMLFAPIALFLIAYKKYLPLVTFSFLIWFTSSTIGLEHFTAWQPLFIAGMVIGSKLDVIIDFFNNRTYRRVILYTSAFLLFTWSTYVDLLFPTIINFHPHPLFLNTLQDTLQLPPVIHEVLFSKEFMPLPRVIVSLLWFIALLVTFSRNEEKIKTVTGTSLSYLGQNSLTVYTIHSFVIFFIFVTFTSNPARPGMAINTVIGIGAIASVFVLTKLYLLIKASFKNKISPKQTRLRLTYKK